jgi:transposase-like protein
MSRSKWTPESIALLQQRLADGVSVTAIAKELGRERTIVRAKIDYLQNFDRGRPGAGNVKAPVISPSQWEERDRRLAAPPRDLTGAMLGDPPVGFSALERRG